MKLKLLYEREKLKEFIQYFLFVSSSALVYMFNHPPPSTITPFKQPDYSCLRVFGCSCFPFLRPYNSHKLDYRSQECIFLGYSTAHKGYKCLAPNGHIYISKDVLFQESKFPYSTLFLLLSQLNLLPPHF